MRFVIVTGMSGAGKSSALNMLEDMRFYCVDNLPLALLEKFVTLMMEARSADIENVALGIDVRSISSGDEISRIPERMKEIGYDFEILFLDASDEVLTKRYKETRRRHPLSGGGRIQEGLEREREMLSALRRDADYIIDTSRLLTRDLLQELERIFVNEQKFGNMMVSVLSFGFKYGIPADADLVFDVRFLPNPYYIDDLRMLTGLDEKVYDYVFKNGDAVTFAEEIEKMMRFLLPRYSEEGKTSLVIAIGCTGGKHRSISMAREVYRRISGIGGFGYRLEHRDLERDRFGKK